LGLHTKLTKPHKGWPKVKSQNSEKGGTASYRKSKRPVKGLGQRSNVGKMEERNLGANPSVFGGLEERGGLKFKGEKEMLECVSPNSVMSCASGGKKSVCGPNSQETGAQKEKKRQKRGEILAANPKVRKRTKKKKKKQALQERQLT